MRAAWWWIDRWRKSTAYTDMTAEQQGVYRNLLDELWLRDGLLPLSEKALAQISGDFEAWPRVRAVVLARFDKTDTGYRHPTHDEVSAQTKSFAEAQAEAGKARWAGMTPEKRSEAARKAAATRWDASRLASGMQAGCKPPSPSPSPSQTPISVSGSEEVPSPPAPAIPKPRKPPTGPQADRMRHWEAEWARTRLGQAWTWQPKDAVAMAKAVKIAGQDPLEVDRRATRLLEDPDPWRAREASPSILLSRWNQLAVEVRTNQNGRGFDAVKSLLAKAGSS